ncbi:uncharacterized protein SPSK_02418 [Sporothrix schenckii 1099-18]|uniref:Zn(2)-C6 fungal-type domain-containing protein n=2 Tax=Sporothrix schenckii TaxID=29908 RepID=U7PS42_SPOS1|nr:uncharacterized protein SPSK_02418 [Sporothrix schenckii 1099-18]ERS97295.1 hypothetical protein HMPREF1624_06627 [Sporothrix schenckii ATCC 58251]KJR86533.1 hypothetical protein SPSK_02418 [Sporothrix schenckii 1099-18]
MDPPEKKTRESTSKVRTGCRTCKARRVKCDEAKPVCKRCAVGGRSCTYVPAKAASPVRQNVIVVYVPPLPPLPPPLPPPSVHDAGIDFFHHHIAASLDGQVDPLLGSAFWGRLVLQLAHAEPCVRHAVAAASLVHQDVQLALRHPAGYVAANRCAHAAWQRAAQSLAARIQRQPDVHLVALVCCLLFTLIEFLRGRAAMAMLHVENGLQILAAHRQSRRAKATITSSRHQSRNRRRDRSAVEDTILPIFARLNIMSTLAGKMTPPAYGTMDDYDGDDDDDDDDEAFDLADVELRLVAILDTCIRFIGQASTKAAALAIDVADFAEQTRLQTMLDAWRRQFERLVGRTSGTRRTRAVGLHHQFMVHVKAVGVWLRVCTTASETAVDAYLADFVELVDHATHVVGGPHATQQQALVSFDIQVLGPLYYTALKCRHPATRRRALALLRCAPRREGLWNAHVAYATAQRVIEREERQLDARGWPAEAARVHGLPLADEESRVRVVGPDLGHVGTPLDLDFNLDIVLSPAHPAALETEFRTKPWGLAGPWHVAQEYITP